MVCFEAALQPAEDLDRLVDRGLGHVDLLETARERMVLLEDAPVLVVGRRADALQLPGRERRLEQVGRVERAARRGARADQRVDLVDEQDRVGVVDELLEHCLQPLLEVAAVLGAGEQRAHVERVHLAAREDLGHLPLDDPAGEALRDRGLADAGLADEERIVLAAPAQRLDHALELALAPDQRIDLPRERHRVQVEGIGLERTARLLPLLLVGLVLALLGLLRLRRLRDPVRDVVDDVEPGDALLVQEVHGVRILLAEDRHQDVRPGDLLLARRLNVQDRALDHALEAERRLGVDLLGPGHRGGVGADELGELLAQLFDIRRAGAQHLGRRRVVQQREQEVLHRDELMTLLARLHERHVKADLEFLGDHCYVSSITHCSGCWCLRA